MPENISTTLPGEEGEESYRRIVGMPSFANNINNLAQQTTSTNLDSQMGRSPFVNTLTKKEYLPPHTLFKGVIQRERFIWDLRTTCILPEFYPLEQTAVFVAHSTCTEVSTRISDVLRERSIEATFDNNVGKVKCTSMDGVDFRVFLYRGKEQYHHGIIVEVQRRFGTSTNFYNDIRAILDAAEGKKTRTLPPAPPLPLAAAKVCEEDDGSFQPDAKSSLKMVCTMLSHPGLDSQCLGLKTLSSLTDPTKMGVVTARCIANELMQPNNNVGGMVAAIILKQSKKEEQQKRPQPKSRQNDYWTSSCELRFLAMTIFANSLQFVSVGNIARTIVEKLLLVLREDLRNAIQSPRMAHIATKCIEHLMDDSSFRNDQFESLMESVVDIGHSKHMLLMHQAELCLQKMRS